MFRCDDCPEGEEFYVIHAVPDDTPCGGGCEIECPRCGSISGWGPYFDSVTVTNRYGSQVTP